MTRRLAVDFNSMMRDEQERVYIAREGSPYEDQSVLADLCHGALVVLSDGEMEVEAMVEFDRKHKAWFGRPDWSTRHDLPSPLSTAGTGSGG
jgi:hypothetical protein